MGSQKRDQLNALLICLSSSSSSCLVGERNLFRENLLGDLGAGSRKAQLLPLLLTSSFLMPRLQLERNCEKGLGFVIRISLLNFFLGPAPGLKLHNAPQKVSLTCTHPCSQFQTII